MISKNTNKDTPIRRNSRESAENVESKATRQTTVGAAATATKPKQQ